jgi:VCBS repeat-containing protein
MGETDVADSIINGTDGDDTLSGGNGKTTIHGLGGNDILYGGNGIDHLFGDGGNDQLIGGNGTDYLTGGAGDDLIDGKLGTDIAYYSGPIDEYSFFTSAGYLYILHLGGAGADGTDRVINVEQLVFADRVINIGSGHNVPVAGDDHVFINEDTGTYNSGAAGVLANDYDFDGDPLTVSGGTFTGTYGTLTLNSNGTYSYTLFASDQTLAQGDNVTDSFNYTVTDNDGSDTGALVFHIAGVNDAPTANPDTGATDENAVLLVDVLANDTDIDNGAVLTVTAATAPAGQGTASVVGNQVQFDPGSDFDDLAEGDSEVVVVGYDIADEHGASSSSTVTITVTGTNDGPVANADTASTDENAVVLVDVLANDTDADNGAILTVTAASAPVGQGTASVVGNQVQFDPGTDFDYLADGESVDVVVSYDIEDDHGATASSTLTITVQGSDDGAVITGTDDGETITGTNGDDTISALGGDDTVFGQGGGDHIFGGDGDDALLGEAGNDVIEGGNDNDFASGGDGNDQLLGQAGNDILLGDDGNDQLTGGDGFDQLYGDAGDDVLAGGNDNDLLFGGDGNDQLSGGAGDDSLDGGEGDDSLGGGDGNDSLSDMGGTNSFTGGIGADQIVAGASSGSQTIDGGDGNDTIRINYRDFASTITTGSGSDTIELDHADLGSEELTVTDFTAGAGGDMFRLDGDDGSLLSLLTGWDGSSNPFGAGFLRLQQDGTDTLLQWDQDGATNGADWETLAIFQNTDASQFTGANFAPNYNPDGSEPAGQTITGTNAGETLVGTVGGDTIDALGGNDFVFGRSGDDLIDGGDGSDQLSGEAGNDVIEGGNDNDFAVGGEGNDQLLGQAGDDTLFGNNGDDQLSGGDGNDQLSGDDGDDALEGGDGDDVLSDSNGANSFVGGLGNDLIIASSSTGAQTIDGGDGSDTIRHYYRDFAGTITTGLGSDTIELANADQGEEAVTVTDFTTGAGGDVVRLDGDGSLLSLLAGWDGSSNPFDSGFLRLTQDGDDTLLEWDQDGDTGGSNYETLVVFQNTDATTFTDANFVPGYDPDGSPPAGETITGTSGDDTLVGTVGGDTINALGGEDYVFGQAGDDVIDGGDGLDNLNGGADDDTIVGGNGDDVLSGDEGNDQLSGQADNDTLFGGEGDDQVSGGIGFDNLNGEGGSDVITGGSDDDFLSGGEGDDSLDGGDGIDFLSGGGGSDAMTGGAGADTFAFDSALEGPDEVTDFVSGSDKIQISSSGFGGGLVPDQEVTLTSGSDPVVEGGVGQFLYDTDNGNLFWDDDGTGSDAAVLIATFSNLPSLATTDFVVV